MVPAFLATWRGYPLPTTWEPTRWATLASRGYLNPDVLPDAIAVAAWLIWAYLTLCILAEAVAQRRRGRHVVAAQARASRLAGAPAAGWRPPAPGALRRGAARWVALASVAVSLLSARAALAAPARPADRPSTAAGAAPASATHLVLPHETLWSITRGAYPQARPGDIPGLVEQVFRANVGVTDPAGRHFHDPNVVNPGLLLRLPASPTATQTGPAAPFVPPGTAHPTPPSAPRTDQPPAVVLPTMLMSGPGGPPPSKAAPTPSSVRPSPGPGSSRPAAPSSHPRPSPTGVARAYPRPIGTRPADHRASPITTPVWVGAAGLLTAAVAATIAARRRRRDQTVDRNSAPPRPDPRAAALHTAVLATVDPTGLSRLDAALRTLAAQWITTAPGTRPPGLADGPEPMVVLVRPDDTIDVYLRDPQPAAPAPWLAFVGGRIWVLPATASLPPLPTLPPPCPLLVQLGTEPDGAELYADLEALGSLTLDPGNTGGDGLRALARALLATLALSPLAARPRVEAVGFDPFGLLDENRVDIADDLPDLLDRITPGLRVLREALAMTGQPSTFAARATVPAENWEPTAALVVPRRPIPEDVEARAGLANLVSGGGQGLAVVTAVAGGPATGAQATWRLVFEGTSGPEAEPMWRLDPLGLHIRPLQLAADELRDLGLLLDDADQAPDAVPPPPAASEPEPYTGPDWQVMIGLLGPLTVVGRDGRRPPAELARERTFEVLAWLATHRGRTRTDLEAAIWPTGAQARSINNQLGRARGILASLAGEQARQWLPTRRTTITLHTAVVTDLDLLHALIAHAEAQRNHPAVAIAALTAGLDLVRGTPARQPWLDAELGSQLTTTVIRAALLLADHQLGRGDTGAVLDATRRGLGVLPAHPGLFARRMRAYAQAGDRSAIRAEYHAYLRAERADPLWDGETDRDLEELHHSLLRQPLPPTPSGTGAWPGQEAH
ncbi:SARP family transcriptional regulator [Frankia sp. AgB32]|uniref:SARP family transcriptional regulator n=1 Tax=Frankia sp. AgB32 TaxID=631119 RepID=UPI00200DD1B3|nr:SARP family transcriptional regulator [Frankia sp. AgB32]MCK9895032.1 SARP family transcriptional regulator [Frankia sp. AgB32]